MDVFAAIKARRSVRSYQDRPVPDEVLQRLLEAARWAPSASNMQPWKLVVVTDPQRRRDLSLAASEQFFLFEAPIILAAVALDPEEVMSCDMPTYPVNIAIALDHLTLAAAAEGLGTCWIGSFSQTRVQHLLDVPPAHKVCILMPLGYPADKPRERERKALEELVCRDHFQ